MLKYKESMIIKKLNRIYDSMENGVYRVKAKDLKSLLGLTINEIDTIIQSGSIPILKYRTIETYYVFPIDYLLNYFFITKGIGMTANNNNRPLNAYFNDI